MFEITEIRQMADRIKGGLCKGVRVFLFGSYAYGMPNECSDVDFAVVVPDEEYTKNIALTARKLSQNGLIPIDVVAYRASTFVNSICGTLSYEIRNKGIEL